MNGEQQWQDVKESYLRQIEKSLAKTDHPRRAEILSDVTEHLQRRYAELPPAEQNWEGYQRIITEMGPPEDYAELLTEERTAKRSRFGINEVLAIVFVLTLIAIGIYLVKTAQRMPPSQPATGAYTFEIDEALIGKWVTVDFVENMNAFDPAKHKWHQELFLQALQFPADGTLIAQDREKVYNSVWTKGIINPDSKQPAAYEIRNIEDVSYLFYEWINGDVAIRGMEPWYYVLVKEE